MTQSVQYICTVLVLLNHKRDGEQRFSGNVSVINIKNKTSNSGSSDNLCLGAIADPFG